MKHDLTTFKACADETRLRILFLLSERELCVCEIVAVLDMPQGKISRHLSVLRNADLVTDRRDGIWIYYALSEPDTGLKHMLHAYLKKERAMSSIAREDLNRLDSLSSAGKICVPQPSRALATSRN